MTWLKSHREITHVSRDRGSEYASAASRGAPQAIQVADLLARVLTELKDAPQAEAQGSVEEWRPAAGGQVNQTISTHRAEREARYQHVERLHQQGLTSQQIAHQLGMNNRTVRHWLK